MMNRQGPAHQQMKLSSYGQTGVAGRGALPNGRLAGGWAGGVPPPPGVPTPASRPNSTMNFSGTLNSAHTQLDLNDFPALGGQPSTNPAQSWNRISTQSPSQNRGPPGNPPPPSQQPQHETAFAVNKDLFGAGMEEFGRLAGGTGVGGGGSGGQQPPQRQGQPTSQSEDFPALPRTQQAMGQLEDRSMGMGVLGGHRGSIAAGSRLLPQDSLMSQMGPMLSDVEKKSLLKGNAQSIVTNGAPGLSNPSAANLPQSLGPPSHPSPAPGLGVPSQLQQQMQQKFPTSPNNGGEFGGNPMAVGAASTMTDSDRYGLNGLLSVIRNEHAHTDNTALAVGQDLTQLGLDLNQPDTALWPSFATPFAELESKAVEPEFHLPQCYTVHNTQPVNTKIQSFSDETLFYIFYTMPRDIMQELVVQELATRNWRYHIPHRLWMTKDENVHVEPISERAERGVYIFFDPNTWERVKKEIVLEYAHLDPRTTGTYTGIHGYPTGVQLGLS